MAQAGNTELVDAFEQFFRNYYDNEIKQLAQRYPNEQRSLSIDWQDLYRFDPDLADDFLNQPEQLQRYAEEALRLYDLPIDVSLGQAHVRIQNLPGTESPEIREIRARNMNSLVQVRGIVRKATDVRPKIEEAAFECQLCGTLNRIPQSSGDFQEPHECQGCERQGPFQVNFDQSEFVDSQKLRIQESPEGLRGGETPQSLDVHIEDDITGEVTPGDNVSATGVLRLEQQGDGQDKSPVFDFYMEGMSVKVEEEQFEDMNITDEDKKRIYELSNEEVVYDRMIASIAPSIYGYDQEKLAMILQLFSGVTKQLPDGSRIRGDLHMLLIGDPGTGKCVRGDTKVTLADGRDVPIREIVESNLEDPKPIDDGWWDEIDLAVPSLQDGGSIAPQRATKVWKREAPERMYRIRTSSGRELEVTPSHPLFCPTPDGFRAVRADRLSTGDRVAVTNTGRKPVSQSTATDALADGGAVIEHQSTDTDRIVSIESLEPDYDWVYDLEIAGTHNYVSNGVVSHNSQMLGYIQNIAPRSVYTSGKGSSSAGLCVTGDTLVHTDDGFQRIRDIVTDRLPEPVDAETAVEDEIDLYTFDRDSGSLETRATSHVWRMPPKQCRRIETARGKELEASRNTPVLTCGDDGFEWKPIAEVEAGEYVAVPEYDDVDRSTPPIEEYLEFTNEKLKLADESIVLVRRRLCEGFGTLREAAAALDFPEGFVYDTIRNRHVPLDRLERILDAIDLELDDLSIDRAMLRHGDSIDLPDEFDDDLCYLLGLIFGDGDIMLSRRGENRGHVRITNSDEAILERATEIVDDTFDKRPEIEYQDGKAPCIRIHSATIARFVANVGMVTPKENLELDPALTTSEHADAFLRGLMDADGSVSARTNGGSSIHLSTISEEFARQVQLMLETHGVRSRVRERDYRGVTVLENGQETESQHVQYHLECYGRDIDRFADAIGFGCPEKQAALDGIVGDAVRRGEKMPDGGALATVDAAAGEYYMNINRGDNPGRERARRMLADVELGGAEPIVEEAVEADLCWDEVVAAVDTGEKEVFDLTVPETHNFVANGVVTHNTAAAVRDDFGDGQQWTLEAGALVLADQGIAAVDELDKMRSEDRSAMHEALEQQKISVSKAGINATLQSRCSLLGAANPKYGRFDQYEPIGEQIDLEPALISRFDLIFTVTDQPDEEKDRNLAEHILTTNYAGELTTQREHMPSLDVSQDEIDEMTETVDPDIDAELLRKYIAFAKQNCHPRMTEEARETIQEFYVDLRSKGADEDAPVPVTARKLEALVRLSEASARVRLSDTVEQADAERVIEIVRTCLQDIGVDPETGEFDADIVEAGTSKSQRDRIKNLKGLIGEIEDEYDDGAPVDIVLERAEDIGMDHSKAEHEIEKLKQKGEVYEPSTDTLRTT
ncbi:LAGLIDADG family homing endonuclease [Natrialba swarupiae]|uniref:DNA helicase n=1 Tax=Natrialba swarupiae TaxID=2448032 RepID=A0A5D5AQZ8_9EURY|nr:LAGLIDADG family homing endonuclease [Natrialba swarupiae]TYT64006.1 MCM family protein [Natrialba swarupiae]